MANLKTSYRRSNVLFSALKYILLSICSWG